MRRINVIGPSCSGKTTFARRLAKALDVPHVELDALHWEPGWVEASPDTFRERVAAALEPQDWVVDGNYAQARDLIWPKLDTIVWLDLSFPVVLWRSLSRTWRRVIRGETCCNGNRESVGRTFSRDSIILWVIQSHAKRRREFQQLLPEVAVRGIEVVTLRSRGEAERWLLTLDACVKPRGFTAI